MMRSIDLGWLSRRDKSIPLPLLAFTSDSDFNEDASGSYYHPESQGYDLFGTTVDVGQALIVIGLDHIDYEKRWLEATLAHEWRHHWQWYNWSYWPDTPARMNKDISYEDATAQYFATPQERDALWYECLMGKSDLSLWRKALTLGDRPVYGY